MHLKKPSRSLAALSKSALIGMTLLCLALPSFSKLRQQSAQSPQALNIVDWKQIRAEYERHRHGAFPDATGLHARSFEQQFLTHFDGRGFTVTPDGANWRWGLELAGVSGKAQVSHEVNRVTYRWSDALDEWYLNDTRGLEHDFKLHARRPEIRLNVRGGLQARAAGSGRGSSSEKVSSISA